MSSSYWNYLEAVPFLILRNLHWRITLATLASTHGGQCYFSANTKCNNWRRHKHYCLWKIAAGETGHLVKCLSRKHKGLSSIPSLHIKVGMMVKLGISELGRRGLAEPCGLMGSQPRWSCEFQDSERTCLQKYHGGWHLRNHILEADLWLPHLCTHTHGYNGRFYVIYYFQHNERVKNSGSERRGWPGAISGERCLLPGLATSIWTPGPAWWKEKTDPGKLSFDLHMHAMTHEYASAQAHMDKQKHK